MMLRLARPVVLVAGSNPAGHVPLYPDSRRTVRTADRSAALCLPSLQAARASTASAQTNPQRCIMLQFSVVVVETDGVEYLHRYMLNSAKYAPLLYFPVVAVSSTSKRLAVRKQTRFRHCHERWHYSLAIRFRHRIEV